ncbi:MAG: ATP-dependent Clp protease ATP-binding subunit [Lachnospiraceae bacterium]|nr:ATP-dependent Clp protease ATP-binding subunit [Lachnospiraceae bacterium]
MFYDTFHLTPAARESLAAAEEAAVFLNQSYVGTEHLLLGLIRVDSGTAEVLGRHEVGEKRVLELVDSLVSVGTEAKAGKKAPDWSPKARTAVEAGVLQAERMGIRTAGTEHILMGLLSEEDSVAMRLLRTMNVNDQKLLFDLYQSMGEEGIPYLMEMRDKNSGEGNESGGSLLEQFSKDLTAMAAAGKLDPVIGRDQELLRMVRTLSRRTKNNPCLIGEPGVGKTAIVEKLAAQIAEGTAPASMSGKRLLALDLAGMVAGTKYRGEFEERIKGVVNEAIADGNVLLFLDELHTLIGAGGSEGGLDAANILKPALSRGELQVIGATTVDEYKKHIEKDAALERRFQQIMVEEPTEEETEEILFGLREKYEAHHHLKISDEAIEAAATLSARYISDRFLPDKAIDLMDEAASKVQLGDGAGDKKLAALNEEKADLAEQKEFALRNNDFAEAKALMEEERKLEEKIARRKKAMGGASAVVTEADIAAVVADWTRIPVSRLTQSESGRLRRLEAELHKRLIGQEDAVKAVSMAVRRGRVGLKDPKRPIGSFLFLGPTGVGKTELAKALAEALFGKEEAMIRVDMSEYMEQHSVSKLIGSPPGYVGYEEGGQFSDRVRRNPYSVILFDEIEKAHPDIFQVLLQILDDGHITDAQGRKVNFKNTIIIMTSNAGAQRIVEPKKLGFSAGEDPKADYEAMKSGVMEEVKRIFRPEFLNRIDEIQVFRSLTNEDLKKILDNQLRDLSRRLEASMEIDLKVTAKAKELILKKGYDPKYGARPLKRAIQTMVEDPLSMEVLDGRLKAGDTARVGAKDGKLTFEAI